MTRDTGPLRLELGTILAASSSENPWWNVKLAIDPSEEAALAENSTRCPNTPIRVQLAR
ncbi:MAG: hypothetical protein WCD21_16100 [Streptomyces sp.]